MSRVFMQKNAMPLIAIIGTVAVIVYGQLILSWGMSSSEMREVYLGLALTELLIYIGWSIVTAYAAVFYSLKSNIEARWKKVGLLCLCAIAPWLVGYLVNLA
ncbi:MULTISPECIES: hypothetical protein [unclassified Idiomarina]|jgi:uncharacterized BrkB/YihY/UPF0761 family membrane protein|uniref:hypothetical protein n=1 Tax=unclassified Idiomarina TaxID=2614829 RepID=UPI000C8B9654|nr:MULTISPECIES: hypothetical protein [unclassified Idiomarina]MAD54654.1 hypothetical protein [Idiomarinaceae bacterium]MEC7642678.1 hypothetical protein [Pseudomonadota bacterium]NQZ05018.1 hypothetical protein [Idiomarina sp.]